MVSPIDLQDNLSKAPLAGREQQIQQATSDLGQRQASQALNQEHVLDQSRTRPSAESDAAEHRVDDHEERSDQGGGQHRRRDEASPEPEAPATSEPDDGGHIIDVVA